MKKIQKSFIIRLCKVRILKPKSGDYEFNFVIKKTGVTFSNPLNPKEVAKCILDIWKQKQLEGVDVKIKTKTDTNLLLKKNGETTNYLDFDEKDEKFLLMLIEQIKEREKESVAVM